MRNVLEEIVFLANELPQEKAESAIGMMLRRVQVAHIWNLGAHMITHPDLAPVYVGADGLTTTLPARVNIPAPVVPERAANGAEAATVAA